MSRPPGVSRPSGASLADLERKIESREAQIGIVGLGYVGLPLALAFARAGLRVVGVDVDADKVGRLNGGRFLRRLSITCHPSSNSGHDKTGGECENSS